MLSSLSVLVVSVGWSEYPVTIIVVSTVNILGILRRRSNSLESVIVPRPVFAVSLNYRRVLCDFVVADRLKEIKYLLLVRRKGILLGFVGVILACLEQLRRTPLANTLIYHSAVRVTIDAVRGHGCVCVGDCYSTILFILSNFLPNQFFVVIFE